MPQKCVEFPHLTQEKIVCWLLPEDYVSPNRLSTYEIVNPGEFATTDYLDGYSGKAQRIRVSTWTIAAWLKSLVRISDAGN